MSKGARAAIAVVVTVNMFVVLTLYHSSGSGTLTLAMLLNVLLAPVMIFAIIVAAAFVVAWRRDTRRSQT